MTCYSDPRDLLCVYSNFTKGLRSSISDPVTLPATDGFRPELAQGSAGDRPTGASRERWIPSPSQISQPGCRMGGWPCPRALGVKTPLLPWPSFHPTTRVSM